MDGETFHSPDEARRAADRFAEHVEQVVRAPTSVKLNPVLVGELVEWLKSQKQSARRDYFLNWFGGAWNKFQEDLKLHELKRGGKVVR